MSDCGCKPAPAPAPGPAPASEARRAVRVDLLYIDIETCDRCQGAARHLDAALLSLRPVLDLLKVDVAVTDVLVDTAAKAQDLRLESSPTVRVDGRDIHAVRESPCGACSSLTSAGGVDCREWTWRGEVYASPPAGMLAEAILRAALDDRPAEPASGGRPYALPDNLDRFFANRYDAGPTPCCSPAT